MKIRTSKKTVSFGRPFVLGDEQKADIAAEERSEDDGMAEHPKKAADPAAWAAIRTARTGAGRR